MIAIRTIIDLANDLVRDHGINDAIDILEDKIKSISPPIDFAAVCKISGYKTAIMHLKGEIK